MKIRGKSPKVDIDTILIQKDAYSGTNVSIIVNNQLIKLYDRAVFTDTIFKKTNEYLKVIGGDNKC